MSIDTLEALWQEQLPVYRRIRNQGMAGYVQQLPNLHLFAQPGEGPGACGCIDSRLRCRHTLPGGGLLLSLEEHARYIEQAAATTKRKIGLISHSGCAAMQAYQASLQLKRMVVNPNLDEFTQEETSRRASKLGIPYFGHIQVEPEYQAARSVLYCATPTQKPHQAGLPPALTVDRYHQTAQQAQRDLALAIRVALKKDQGFGQLISPQEPLYVVAVGWEGQFWLPLADLLGEISTVLGQFDAHLTYPDSFQVPKVIPVH